MRSCILAVLVFACNEPEDRIDSGPIDARPDAGDSGSEPSDGGADPDANVEDSGVIGTGVCENRPCLTAITNEADWNFVSGPARGVSRCDLIEEALFAIPISGWVVNSSAGFPLQWFGLFNLPAIVERSHDLHEIAEEAHELMFWLLALMVAAHAGAAFYHHLFQQDATLARMLPRGWLKAPGAPAAVGADATEAAPAASSPQTPNE